MFCHTFTSENLKAGVCPPTKAAKQSKTQKDGSHGGEVCRNGFRAAGMAKKAREEGRRKGVNE